MRDTSSYTHESFACSCQNLEWDIKRIFNFVREILQKKKIKMGSSQQSKNSLRLYIRFLYGAWWDNTKFQTQQNWNKLNQSYNIFRSLRNARTFSPLQWTYIIFPFSFLDYFLMSFYVLFLHLCVISSVIRFKQVKFTVVKKKNWPASISICYLRVKGISGIYIYIYI